MPSPPPCARPRKRSACRAIMSKSIGRLDTYITGTGFEITPIVGLVRAPFTLRLDPFEVAEVFEVPLAYILDPPTTTRQSRELRGRTRIILRAALSRPQHLGRDRRRCWSISPKC